MSADDKWLLAAYSGLMLGMLLAGIACTVLVT